MLFITGKTIKAMINLLRRRDQVPVHSRRQRAQRAQDNSIHRDAHTAYKVHREENGDWLLCYTAVVRLHRKDIDNDFFGEDGRTGYTRATIWGDGKIHFQEEIVHLDEDEYIFARRPYEYPFPYRRNSPRHQRPAEAEAEPQNEQAHRGPDEIIHADYWPEMNIEMV